MNYYQKICSLTATVESVRKLKRQDLIFLDKMLGMLQNGRKLSWQMEREIDELYQGVPEERRMANKKPEVKVEKAINQYSVIERMQVVKIVDRLHRLEYLLNDWERQFISDLYYRQQQKYGIRYTLSSKQVDRIKKINGRIETSRTESPMQRHAASREDYPIESRQ